MIDFLSWQYCTRPRSFSPNSQVKLSFSASHTNTRMRTQSCAADLSDWWTSCFGVSVIKSSLRRKRWPAICLSNGTYHSTHWEPWASSDILPCPFLSLLFHHVPGVIKVRRPWIFSQVGPVTVWSILRPFMLISSRHIEHAAHCLLRRSAVALCTWVPLLAHQNAKTQIRARGGKNTAHTPKGRRVSCCSPFVISCCWYRQKA